MCPILSLCGAGNLSLVSLVFEQIRCARLGHECREQVRGKRGRPRKGEEEEERMLQHDRQWFYGGADDGRPMPQNHEMMVCGP